MASRRALITALVQPCRAALAPAASCSRRGLVTATRPSPRPRTALSKPGFALQPRFFQTTSGPKKYTFEDIQSRLDTSPESPTSTPLPNSNPLIIIDVREPSELAATGRIPGAHNIPISSAPEGLFLPEDEFEDRWGFKKPKAGDEVVFYCKAGVRSRAAAGMVKGMEPDMLGGEGHSWEGVNVGEFPGSWVEWEARGGEVE